MEVGDSKTRPKWYFWHSILAKSGRIRVADACGIDDLPRRSANQRWPELVEPKKWKYHTTFSGTLPRLKRTEKVVATGHLPVKGEHCRGAPCGWVAMHGWRRPMAHNTTGIEFGKSEHDSRRIMSRATTRSAVCLLLGQRCGVQPVHHFVGHTHRSPPAGFVAKFNTCKILQCKM
jgi:hypothetical protein